MWIICKGKIKYDYLKVRRTFNADGDGTIGLDANGFLEVIFGIGRRGAKKDERKAIITAKFAIVFVCRCR